MLERLNYVSAGAVRNKNKSRSDPAYVNVEEIKAEYAPYHTMIEFEQGYADYMAGKVPAFDIPGVAAQAYDRGGNAAMQVLAAARWVETNVGSN